MILNLQVPIPSLLAPDPRVSLGFMEGNPRHHITASIKALCESQEKDNSLETGS